MTETDKICVECAELFPPGSRRYEICTGDAIDVPLVKVNNFRERRGLAPIPDDGRPRPERVVHSGTVERKPKPFKAKVKRRSKPKKVDSQRKKYQGRLISSEAPPEPGVGSELIVKYAGAGVAGCAACKDMAKWMNQWGPKGCRLKMGFIVDDMLPRAWEWLEKQYHRISKIGSREQKEWMLRKVIEHDVNQAIKRVETGKTLVGEWQRRDSSKLLADTEIVVKSFMRHDFLLEFVESIRERYPTIGVRVVDDSFANGSTSELAEQIKQMPGVHWHQASYDIGLPTGRNIGVRESSAKYVIICDDDFIFTEDTNLEAMLWPVADKATDICGGLVRMDGKTATNWCGMFQLRGKQMKMRPVNTPIEYHRGAHFRRCNVTYNFFAARRQTLLDHPWDEGYIIGGEHLDSFLTWHLAGLRVAYTANCCCAHQSKNSNREYRSLRGRTLGTTYQLRDKWDFKIMSKLGVTKFPMV